MLKHPVMPRSVPLLTCLLVTACGSEPLTPQMVTSIPDGSALGTGYSGRYVVEARTVECDGTCGAGDESVCELGQLEELSVLVRQADGHLRLQPEDADLGRLEGGAYRDGSFEVGAYAPASDLEKTAHAMGSINELGELSSTVRVRIEGHLGDQRVDCLRVQELFGTRGRD